MCQLTLVDIDPQEKFDIKYLLSILTLNAIDGNLDGFGYFNFNDGLLFKTEKPFPDWISSNTKRVEDFIATENYNGMYHVRAASTTYKNKIRKEDAHPHTCGDIVVIHNGTLTRKHTKTLDLIEKTYNLRTPIDSKLVTCAIHYYSYGNGSDKKELTSDSIIKAVGLFNGTYALIIYDKSTNRVFLAKDSRKPMSITHLKKKNKVVGCILNSVFYMAYGIAFMNRYITNTISDYGYKIDTVEDDKIYEYKLGEYKLEEIAKIPLTIPTPELDKVVYKQYNQFGFKTPAYQGRGVTHSEYQDFIFHICYPTLNSLVTQTALTPNELLIMFEMLFCKSIFVASEDNILEFIDILKKSVNENVSIPQYNIAMELMDKIREKKAHPYTLYENLEFPYYLNTVKELNDELATHNKKV